MQSNSTSILPEASTRSEAGLKLSLVCPQCGAAGWTGLDGLKRGMRCPKCRCQFLVDSTGRLLREDQLNQVRYTCPRCRQSGTIPARLKVRKAVCGGCRLTLAAGPDEQLYGEKEAAQMRRAASAAAGQQRPGQRMAAKLTTADGRLHWLNVSLLAAVVGGLLASSVLLLSRLFDSSTDTQVCSFTYTCLSGDWHEARIWLPDDAVQRAEFDRWRVRHFSSILDSLRPPGDRVEVEAALTRDESTRRVFHVSMTSPLLGTRSHDQHWVLVEGTWSFDPQNTLAAADSVVRRGKRQ
jgi:hypothetical protein